jgi:hypothetical protein
MARKKRSGPSKSDNGGAANKPAEQPKKAAPATPAAKPEAAKAAPAPAAKAVESEKPKAAPAPPPRSGGQGGVEARRRAEGQRPRPREERGEVRRAREEGPPQGGACSRREEGRAEEAIALPVRPQSGGGKG